MLVTSQYIVDLWELRHAGTNAQSCQRRPFSFTHYMEVSERPDSNLSAWLQWSAAHTSLKNVFTHVRYAPLSHGMAYVSDIIYIVWYKIP